jgi:hypothetical protein
VSADNPETAASVNIGAISYRARRNAPRCHSDARLIFRYADASGRPTGNLEFCHTHAHARMAWARMAGLKVFDDREA